MSTIEQDLVTTIDRIAADHCDRGAREQAEKGEWPTALWQALTEVGLTGATVPEEAGGTGLEFDDAMAALRRSAYHALPVPLAETYAAARLLVAAGLSVPEGALTVAPSGGPEALTLVRRDGTLRITGSAHRVPWGGQCQATIAVAQLDGRDMLVVVDGSLGLVSSERNLAGEPRAALRFDGTPVIAAAPLDHASDRLTEEGALMRSVQMTGALSRSLEHAIQYANERVAFGRPIAKFQAVQQMLAVMAGHVAAASAAADFAVELSADMPNRLAIAVAKSRIGEAAGRSAEIAHQVHGAMGFTHEHNLHWSTRRLWAWRDEFGGDAHWQMQLGRAAAAAGPEALWSLLATMSPGVAAGSLEVAE
ncbi:MAG: Acyl-CoA dehydrogenase [Variovorax sp.]|nr:Acyl-CoA dehydrogenase [Variovorax sp.]